MPIEKKCEVCSKPFNVPPSRAVTAKTCSNECAVSVRAKSRERKLVCVCKSCGKKFQAPQSQAGRRIYCSDLCKNISPSYSGEMSAKLRGENNGAWRGGETLHAQGYVYMRSPEHPFASNGYVFKHRLVMEEWLREAVPGSKFLMNIAGQGYLLPGIDVHHMDENPKNNERTNLVACTSQTHNSIHSGYGAQPGTYWPVRPDIKVDTVSPATRQRDRRREQRRKRNESK
jgi:hypothetical protein